MHRPEGRQQAIVWPKIATGLVCQGSEHFCKAWMAHVETLSGQVDTLDQLVTLAWVDMADVWAQTGQTADAIGFFNDWLAASTFLVGPSGGRFVAYGYSSREGSTGST